jgi:ribosomal protein S18 acetylase RimI-like enzyme
MVNLLLLTEDRFEDFYALFVKVMKEGYSGFPDYLIEYFLKNDYSKFALHYWFEKGLRRMTLALDENKLVGFLIGDTTYGGVGFISWVAIEGEYRGKGVGKMLFLDYEEYAKKKKAHLIELFTYDKVKPFYEKLGMKEIGRREEGFYGQKNVIMNKKIGSWNKQYIILDEI